MSRFNYRRLYLSAVALLTLGTTAQASEIAFNFDGTVTNAEAMTNISSGFAQLPPGVVVGAPVLATLAYDTATVPGTSIPNVLTYAATGFTLNIAGNLWISVSPEIFIGSEPMSGVRFMTVSVGTFTTQPPPPSVPSPITNGELATLSISSSAPDFLLGLQLPTAPLDLALTNRPSGNFVANSCECFGTGPGDAFEEIDFSLTSMTLAVSEPSPLALLITSLLVLFRLHRRASSPQPSPRWGEGGTRPSPPLAAALRIN